MIKRNKRSFRNGLVIDIEEYHDGNYGAPGQSRLKKKKPTKEQMQKVNAANKAKRCRYKLLEYFDSGDAFATLTYEVDKRPQDMSEAKKHFAKLIRTVRKAYKTEGHELYWIRNIEKGTKGAWHIHLVINEIEITSKLLNDNWPYGGIYYSRISKNTKIYDEDFTKLANYITKDEYTTYKKKDGSEGRSRLAAASYSTSRNMTIEEPKVDKIRRWKEEPQPKKGYYIAHIYEGLNPVTGYRYRRYTMIKLNRRI